MTRYKHRGQIHCQNLGAREEAKTSLEAALAWAKEATVGSTSSLLIKSYRILTYDTELICYGILKSLVKGLVKLEFF